MSKFTNESGEEKYEDVSDISSPSRARRNAKRMFNIKQKIHEKKQGVGTSNMLSELDLTHQTVNVLDDKRRANRNVGEQPSLSP